MEREGGADEIVYVGAGLPEHGVLLEEQLPHLMWEKNAISFTFTKSGEKFQPARILSRYYIFISKIVVFSEREIIFTQL